MKQFVLLLALLFCFTAFGYSADFGLLLNQNMEAENKLLTYSPGFVPWLSWNGGEGVSFYISADFSFKYYINTDTDNLDETSGWSKPPLCIELGRTALTYRINPQYSLEAGRIGYSDALGLTASGLFDGARMEAVFDAGTLYAGVYYTGLLYKETANIIMSPSDSDNYSKPWDYGSFGDYFASRRLMLGVRWDMPLLEYQRLSLEGIFQFDVNGNSDSYHSQYGEAFIEYFLPNNMALGGGFVLEAFEAGGNFGIGFGLLGRLKTEVPGSLNDGFSLAVKSSSGSWSDTVTFFTPISSVTQGNIFPGSISGITVISAEYDIRITEALYAEACFRYFISPWDNPVLSGNLYGGELWGSLVVQPLEDFRLTCGGGAFLPNMGNAYPSDFDTMWKVIISLTLSF